MNQNKAMIINEYSSNSLHKMFDSFMKAMKVFLCSFAIVVKTVILRGKSNVYFKKKACSIK